MKHELTYKLPYEQSVKLCRTGRRKLFKTTRLIFWVFAVTCAATGIAIGMFKDVLDKWMDNIGIPLGSIYVMIVAILLLSISIFFYMKKVTTAQAKNRVDFDQSIKLTFKDEGLKIVSSEIEYLVKWQGIHQLFVVRDGIVILAGNLLFVVPNVAFPTLEEKRTFLQDVYSCLSEKARSLSEKDVRAVLNHDTP